MWFKRQKDSFSSSFPNYLLFLSRGKQCYQLIETPPVTFYVYTSKYEHSACWIYCLTIYLVPFSPFPLPLFDSPDALDCCLHFTFIPHFNQSSFLNFLLQTFQRFPFCKGRNPPWILVWSLGPWGIHPLPPTPPYHVFGSQLFLTHSLYPPPQPNHGPF